MRSLLPVSARRRTIKDNDVIWMTISKDDADALFEQIEVKPIRHHKAGSVLEVLSLRLERAQGFIGIGNFGLQTFTGEDAALPLQSMNTEIGNQT